MGIASAFTSSSAVETLEAAQIERDIAVVLDRTLVPCLQMQLTRDAVGRDVFASLTRTELLPPSAATPSPLTSYAVSLSWANSVSRSRFDEMKVDGEWMSIADTDRRDQIVQVAGELLEREGPAGLTMRGIARELGIKAPSLYKHIADKRELEVALIADGFRDLGDAFDAALAEGGDPIAVISHTYRRWALERPHLYALMNSRPLPQDAPAIATEQRALAMVLAAFSGDHERARAAWAFAHGMVTLELADRFPQDADIERTWSIGIAAFAHEPNSPKGSMQ